MIFPLTTALVFTAATLLLAALVGVAVGSLRRRRSFWRGVLWTHAGLFALHALVTFPLGLGWLGSRTFVGTRHNERPYAGPRLLADGTFAVQSWDTLKQERDSRTPVVPPDVVAAAAARAHTIPSSGGVALRAFRLEAKQQPPTAVAILVHGLFRSALEPEPVAAMLREQGCECWLVELRNFGGSSRAPFTAGLRESDDVVAAAAYVRAQPDRATTPLILHGVSFGTVAISLALPRIDHVAGVVLDAPIEDMGEAASRLLAMIAERRPNWAIAPPWQALVLRSLELWSGIELAAVRPADVLATLPPDIPMLVVGAGIDDRAPPATVERLFARLPMHAANKRLWMVPESTHGRVFLDEPVGYAEQLRWLLARLRPAATAR